MTADVKQLKPTRHVGFGYDLTLLIINKVNKKI